jgi:hypothetical protein
MTNVKISKIFYRVIVADNEVNKYPGFYVVNETIRKCPKDDIMVFDRRNKILKGNSTNIERFLEL